MSTTLTFSDLDRMPFVRVSSFDMLVAPMSESHVHDPLVMSARLTKIGSITVTVNASTFENRDDFETLLADAWLMGQLVAYTVENEIVTARGEMIKSIMDHLRPEHIDADVAFDDIYRVNLVHDTTDGERVNRAVSRKFVEDENEFIEAIHAWLHRSMGTRVTHVDLVAR